MPAEIADVICPRGFFGCLESEALDESTMVAA
jgi:hypothetical protein